MGHILSASKTASGCPVYLDRRDAWQLEFAKARVFETSEELSACLSAARDLEGLICDPFAISVSSVEGVPLPQEQKWAIRSAGGDATLTALGYAPDGHGLWAAAPSLEGGDNVQV